MTKGGAGPPTIATTNTPIAIDSALAFSSTFDIVVDANEQSRSELQLAFANPYVYCFSCSLFFFFLFFFIKIDYLNEH